MADLGRWEPYDIDRITALFDGASFDWWLSGGYAIDSFVGRTTRAHDDIDVAVLRRDQLALRAFVEPRLELVVAHAGRLSPWGPGVLAAEIHGLWARDEPAGPWRLQVNLEESDGETWIYRRDPRVRRPIAEVVWHRADGLPFVNPGVQLLYKTELAAPKDRADLDVVLPLLPVDECSWLRDAVRTAHPASTLTSLLEDRLLDEA